MTYLDEKRVKLLYSLPLNEIIYDFFDNIKSRTRGYASFDYEITGYERSDLVKLDIMLNGDVCDALSMIVHKDRAYPRGRELAENLKDAIPRQLFEIPIQAAVGGKIICPRNGQGGAQRRARQMLRRRYHPQEKTSRKTERGQKAHAQHRLGGSAFRSVYVYSQNQ